jgi:protoheme IX farnesyltransferase
VPQALKAYYRLTKPGIVYGNTLSVLAGFLLASDGHIDLELLAATVVGIALIMAAACVYNNYIDRGIDARMARTKKRDLVTGTVGGRPAIVYATVLGTLGFTMLLLFTNSITVILGVIAITMYVIVYGAAKRLSPLGTIVGSVSGALPPAAGYTAVTGNFDLAAWLLFLAMTFWQMPHFYAIAIYRLKDYIAAGIPVLPAKRGIKRTKIGILLYIVAYGLAASLLTVFGYTGYIYLGIVVLLSLLWLFKGLRSYRVADDVVWARQMFFFSLKVLLAWATAIAIDSFFN